MQIGKTTVGSVREIENNIVVEEVAKHFKKGLEGKIPADKLDEVIITATKAAKENLKEPNILKKGLNLLIKAAQKIK